MSIRQFRIITVVLMLLILLSSVYHVGAAPPEPTQEPNSTPEPPVGAHTTISIGEHMTIDIDIEASPQSPATLPAAPILQDTEPAGDSHNAISLLAVDGPWTGTTSRGYPMSFNVASGGTTWSTFKLKTDFSVGGCSGTVETTVFGPGPITNNQFSSSTGSFSFSGQFSTPTSANGTYAYVNHSIPGCGIFNQSGTWTANTTSPPPTTPNLPSNLTALAVSQMQILLQWQDNSNNETGFKIEQSLTAIGPWTQIATTPANVTSHAPPGLTCGTTYYYRIRAYNGSGNSAYSNIANATTMPCSGFNIHIYLPVIMRNFAPTPAPTPSPGKPKDGHWTGTTSRSQPMSFDVSSGGTVLNNFKLKTTFQVGPCSGTVETTVSSPRPITNNQFSSNGGSFVFSGQFNTSTSAGGTYAYINQFIPNCGIFNQSGTWTANTP